MRTSTASAATFPASFLAQIQLLYIVPVLFRMQITCVSFVGDIWGFFLSIILTVFLSGLKMSKKLYDIVSKVFNVNLDRINDDSSPENLEEWDSFNFYVLLDEIENEFDVKFDLDETLEIKKIGDVKKLFVKYGIRCE